MLLTIAFILLRLRPGNPSRYLPTSHIWNGDNRGFENGAMVTESRHLQRLNRSRVCNCDREIKKAHRLPNYKTRFDIALPMPGPLEVGGMIFELKNVLIVLLTRGRVLQWALVGRG